MIYLYLTFRLFPDSCYRNKRDIYIIILRVALWLSCQMCHEILLCSKPLFVFLIHNLPKKEIIDISK